MNETWKMTQHSLDPNADALSGYDVDNLKANISAHMFAPLNTSGIVPNGFNVLILPDEVKNMTAGGIHLPDEKVTKDEFATTDGTIIAVTTAAFAHITEDEWDGTKPKPGDHVVFTKYAGFRKKGKDGKTYLLVKGEDIHATIEE